MVNIRFTHLSNLSIRGSIENLKSGANITNHPTYKNTITKQTQISVYMMLHLMKKSLFNFVLNIPPQPWGLHTEQEKKV